MPFYTLQPSLIWDGGEPRVDTTKKKIKVKAKNLTLALKKTDPPGLGRVWVHIPKTESKETDE